MIIFILMILTTDGRHINRLEFMTTQQPEQCEQMRDTMNSVNTMPQRNYVCWMGIKGTDKRWQPGKIQGRVL